MKMKKHRKRKRKRKRYNKIRRCNIKCSTEEIDAIDNRNSGSWIVNYLYCLVYSSDLFGNKCYGYIYGRSTLDSTEIGCNYYSYTTALDITGSDSDSVCGSLMVEMMTTTMIIVVDDLVIVIIQHVYNLRNLIMMILIHTLVTCCLFK